jgi:hypothetical protein
LPPPFYTGLVNTSLGGDFIEETESTATNGSALAASQVARDTQMRFSKGSRKEGQFVVLVAEFDAKHCFCFLCCELHIFSCFPFRTMFQPLFN